MTVIAIDGAPSSTTVIDALAREVIDVELATPLALDGPAPQRPLVLLWMPPRVPEALLARVVLWSAARQPRAGLIGCAPAGDLADSEAALAVGFDDFVAGPYSAREIAARLRALHRRVHWTGRRTSRLRFGGMMLDTDGHELWFGGRTVTLTGTELAVVRALMRARGGALTRAELLDHAWGDGHLEISERAVDNVVLRLRRKLGTSNVIQTVRGVGFRLAAE